MNRKDLILITIILIIGWCIGKYAYRNVDKEYTEKIVYVKSDSIPYQDSVVLNSLVKPLQKREGLALMPYSDGKYKYVYYGHLILPTDTFTVYTEKTANLVLWNDIKNAYWELRRLQRKTLYSDIKDIFISGRLLH